MQQIEPLELASLLADPNQKEIQLLDVREEWEIAGGTIAGSACIPMREIVSKISTLDADKLTVCICHHGTRSMQVAHFLERQGFQQVLNLASGIDGWSRQVDSSIPLY
jgi:rhodanese-related sulfurtransferase